MSLSVQDVFNLLSADPKFVAKLETSVKNIMKDGKIDQYDVPELVFIITDSYNEMSRFRLTYDELPQLIKMIYAFMVQKLNLIPDDKRPEFDRLVDSALRLVMMQPVVKQAVTSCFSKIFPCCFKTDAEEPVPASNVVSGVDKKEPVATPEQSAEKKEESKPSSVEMNKI